MITYVYKTPNERSSANRDNRVSPINWTACFWTVRGNSDRHGDNMTT